MKVEEMVDGEFSDIENGEVEIEVEREGMAQLWR